MSKATEDFLASLHNDVAQQLSKDIKSTDEKVRLRAIAESIKFLNQNNIQVVPGTGSAADELENELKDLPEFDETDELVANLDDYRSK